MTGPEHLEEIGIWCHNGYKGEYVWNIIPNSLGCFLMLPCPVAKVYEKLKDSPGTTTNDPSGMKVWVTPTGKELWPAERLKEKEIQKK